MRAFFYFFRSFFDIMETGNYIKRLIPYIRLKYSLKEHQEIVEALKRKNAEQADKLSQKHIENVLANILAHKEKEEDKYKNA